MFLVVPLVVGGEQVEEESESFRISIFMVEVGWASLSLNLLLQSDFVMVGEVGESSGSEVKSKLILRCPFGLYLGMFLLDFFFFLRLCEVK